MTHKLYGFKKSCSLHRPVRGKIFLLIVLFSCFLHEANGRNTCKSSQLLSDLENIACSTSGLRKAVEKDNLFRRMANADFFTDLAPQDVVRARESLSFFNRALTNKIQEVHKKYQQSNTENYTISTAAYPAQVKENSCPNNKTINYSAPSTKPPRQTIGDIAQNYDPKIEKDISDIYQDYSVVEGKPPRFFQSQMYKGRPIICETTSLSNAKRKRLFCGENDEDGKDEYEQCQRTLPPSCSEIIDKGKPSQEKCVLFKRF